MVSASESAIWTLDEATGLSDKANAGWFAGSRAAIGNHLPDWLFPDRISSLESSEATSNIGGKPTKEERKMLHDLQATLSIKEVRKLVFAQARELAEGRLAFNRQWAAELHGGTYHKSREACMTPSASTDNDPLGLRSKDHNR